MQKTFFRRLKEVFVPEQTPASNDLTARFHEFQAVLDGNNRALEAMTEMGESSAASISLTSITPGAPTPLCFRQFSGRSTILTC